MTTTTYRATEFSAQTIAALIDELKPHTVPDWPAEQLVDVRFFARCADVYRVLDVVIGAPAYGATVLMLSCVADDDRGRPLPVAERTVELRRRVMEPYGGLTNPQAGDQQWEDWMGPTLGRGGPAEVTWEQLPDAVHRLTH